MIVQLAILFCRLSAVDLGSRFPVTRYWGQLRFAPASPVPVPALWHRFDWVVQPALKKHFSPSPKSVFCNPAYLHILHSKVQQLPTNVSRTLAIGGDDHKLSVKQSLVRALMPHFSRIFYEAYDIAMPNVTVLPIGLQEFYYREQPEAEHVIDRTQSKKHGVVAMWGAFWKLPNIESRKTLSKFCKQHGHLPWLRCKPVKKAQWWSQLAVARFMLYPQGNGVQSPKQFEALLVGTLPIALRAPAFEALAAAGWPIIIVDSWDEVLSKEKRDFWWANYHPRLAAIRKHGLLTEKAYYTYLVTGNVSSPLKSIFDHGPLN